ncbi:MAG: hypothetical protein ICV68_13410, partial [Pyrinomonadaceae bacterium]|nr:hypothetical protein [Pyrinomonadaceae bacterium]
MSLRAFALIIAAICAATAQTYTAQAQSTGGKTAAKPAEKTRASGKASTDASADPLLEIRRTTAVSLALGLADDARSFRDPVLAAGVQARAADALWEADNDRARALFRRAWDTADAADREALRRQEEERRRQVDLSGASAQINAPNLRAEVLRLAARRDRTLGEEFLAKLDEAKKQEDEDAASAAARESLDSTRASQVLSQRLRLASSLLDEDEIERAIEF